MAGQETQADITEQQAPDASGFAPLTFDVENYRTHVKEFDMTEAQGRELLGALWSVMVSFVDLGFGIHPVQQAREAVHDQSNSLSADSDAALASVPVLTSQFTTSAAPVAGRGQGRKES